MNINKNELFNIKKARIKKANIRKLGVLGIIFLFGTAAFISGFSINSYAASSNTVLSVARGGTGQNALANVMGVGSANKLATARTINGINFDGTQNISIPSATYNTLTVATGPTIAGGYTVYLKVQMGNVLYASSLILDFAGKINGNGAATGWRIEYTDKPHNLLPIKRSLFIEENRYNPANITDFSFVQWYKKLVTDNTTYIKFKWADQTRNYFWQSSDPGTKVTLITDETELAEMEAITAWKNFNLERSYEINNITPNVVTSGTARTIKIEGKNILSSEDGTYIMIGSNKIIPSTTAIDDCLPETNKVLCATIPATLSAGQYNFYLYVPNQGYTEVRKFAIT
ncbi:MAG: hypothetical protein LBT91_00440 [Bifidobacteriaceae bacterium]|jgi:hypothetical protein|nr:hypothetical protein [Bifidobacteriaceae bacterium]